MKYALILVMLLVAGTAHATQRRPGGDPDSPDTHSTVQNRIPYYERAGDPDEGGRMRMDVQKPQVQPDVGPMSWGPRYWIPRYEPWGWSFDLLWWFRR